MTKPTGDGDTHEPAPPPATEPTVVSLGRYSGLGLQWAASVGLFLAAGRWLDKRIGTDPYLTIVGAFVGGAAGFYSLYAGLMKGQKKSGRRS